MFAKFCPVYRSLHTAIAITTEPEAFFAPNGVAFPTRMFDLAMMGYHLVGGGTHALRGRPSALFVYRAAGGRALSVRDEGTLARRGSDSRAGRVKTIPALGI
jgi:hypothetical protein